MSRTWRSGQRKGKRALLFVAEFANVLEKSGTNLTSLGEAVVSWKRVLCGAGVLWFGVAVTTGQQRGLTDDSGRVTALENAWNHAIEAKDTAALDLILGRDQGCGVSACAGGERTDEG